jgi:hypothetical protein
MTLVNDCTGKQAASSTSSTPTCANDGTPGAPRPRIPGPAGAADAARAPPGSLTPPPFLGDGLMWLAVRGQHPYHGPNPGGYAAVVILSVLVSLASVGQARAESGVHGPSVMRRWTFFLSVLAGIGGAFAIEGALAHAGASRPVVGVFEAVAPIAVIGLVYLARFSAEQEWVMAGLGLWLVIVAAVGAYAGPPTVWAVAALAVGPALLLAAAVEQRLQRA